MAALSFFQSAGHCEMPQYKANAICLITLEESDLQWEYCLRNIAALPDDIPGPCYRSSDYFHNESARRASATMAWGRAEKKFGP